jgi:YegS/Rv2252/BmrU family lipid kinase
MNGATTAAVPLDRSLAVRSEPFLVVNPHSGHGATGRRWKKMETQARRAFGGLAHAFTAGPLDATRLTRQALEQGYKTICAVGGDGTINEVVNGFFKEDGSLVSPDAAIAVLPSGTGGDFRRTVGISTDWSAAVAHVASAAVRKIDVGRVRFRAHDGSAATRYFLNVASFGVSGAVDEAVHNSSSKLMGGRLSFMIATVRALLAYRDKTVRISIDDAPFETRSITSIALGNGQYFGGGMWVAPKAKLDDGILSGTIWAGYTTYDFIVKSRGIYSGQHVTWDRTKCFEARKLVAESDERVLIDIDGEQPGILPATFEILPGVLGLRA